MHIGLDSELRAGEKPAQRGHILAPEPQSAGQLEPARDAAVVLALPIMIVQAAPPLAPDRAVFAARNQARILDWDQRLIIIAIECPGLHLALGAFATVQQPVKRMQAMIALRTDIAQLGFQLIGCHQLHSLISSPSAAISKPASSTCRRSGEPSTRIGLVLLMW